MKPFVVFIFAVSAVSSLGSGPYLPSGWRPKGAALLLPTEDKTIVITPASETLKTDKNPESNEDIIQESEPSGSSVLREYGPPDVLNIFTITEQALPEVETERAFAVSDAKTENDSQVDIITDFPQLKSGLQKKVSAENSNIVAARVIIATNDDQSQGTTEVTVNTAEITTTKDQIINERIIQSQLDELQTAEKESLTILSNVENPVNDSQVENQTTLANEILQLDNGSQIQENITTNLEYLPPINIIDSKVQEVVPLYKAELETDSQIALKAVTNGDDLSSVDKDNFSEKSITVEQENSYKMVQLDDEVTVRSEDNDSIAVAAQLANQESEERNGSGPASNDQDPDGFKEYGPPKEDDKEAQRIQNNEVIRLPPPRNKI